MKFLKSTILILLLLTLVANAQLMDLFNGTRILTVSGGILTSNITTNSAVDLIGYYGRADIIISTSTNAVPNTNTDLITPPSGTLGVGIQVSSDTTNWSYLNNYALISSTTAVNYTNLYYGNTNLVVTDNFLQSFTATTPTPYSAGFATPYASPLMWTNTATNISVIAQGSYVVGINVTDNPRYLRTIFTASGGASTNLNTTYSVLLIGNRIVTP